VPRFINRPASGNQIGRSTQLRSALYWPCQISFGVASFFAFWFDCHHRLALGYFI
jgi:hypothetical protein